MEHAQATGEEEEMTDQRDELERRLLDLTEHTADVHFTCDIVHALARAVLAYRAVADGRFDFERDDDTQLMAADVELAKHLGVES